MKILVLPGMGDILWVATFLQSFIATHDLGVPEVYVWDLDGRKRSLEYVERIPFVKSAGYFEHPASHPAFGLSYHRRRHQSIHTDVLGHDYYLAVNAALRWGRSIPEAVPYDVDWYFPLVQTDAEAQWGETYRRRHKDYIVAHFSEFGMFEHWVRAWRAKGCAAFINRVQDRTGLPVLLTGSAWDRSLNEDLAKRTGAVNLCGETDIDQFFGLLRNAKGCAGWCGGNTIQSTVLKVPTLIAWSDYFPDPRFFKNACPPDAWENWYRAVNVDHVSPYAAADTFVELLT